MWLKILNSYAKMEECVSVDEMRNYVLRRKMTHEQISEELQRRNSGVRGLSVMSVRRFCSKHNIHRTTQISDGELDCAVLKAVSQVGPTYGRKMMQGKLAAENIKVHDKRISRSLQRVTPTYSRQREQNTAKLLNPVPYHADYFGHKMHLDQNEKLVMYGCTTVLAIDGYSSSVLAVASMPVKNNIEIYRSVFRPVILQYGLWDQVRVDCGKEFYLILFIQQSLAQYRRNTLRAPYKQTPSTQNHMAERHWVEINSRINYPIKMHLNKMVQDEMIDMTNPVDQFCVSTVVIQVVQAGVQELLPAWNNHSIPGKGKPVDLMMGNYKAVCIPETQIPLPEIAAQQFERSGGKLKNFGNFGTDPLQGYQHLQALRQQEFKTHTASYRMIFNAVANNDPRPLIQSIMCFIETTKHFSPNLEQ